MNEWPLLMTRFWIANVHFVSDIGGKSGGVAIGHSR